MFGIMPTSDTRMPCLQGFTRILDIYCYVKKYNIMDAFMFLHL